MNRLHLFLAGLLVCLAVLPASGASRATSEKAKTLKVLSWNVWHRGHSETYGQKACDGVIGILKASGADVILMVETYGTSAQVADSLGYYHRLLSDNLCVYSRYPIVKTYTFPRQIPTFNFGGVEIDVDGQRVRVFDTWLHYLPDMRLVPTDKTEKEILAWDDEGSRDDEIRTILRVLSPLMAEADRIPVVMGGDFNVHSHLDWTEATKDMYNHGGAVVRWTVSSAMQQAGFKDSFREVHPRPEEYLGTTWRTAADKVETPNRADRIDFIYYLGKKLRPVASDCYDHALGEEFPFAGKSFFYASDHGFVLTTFELEKQ